MITRDRREPADDIELFAALLEGEIQTLGEMKRRIRETIREPKPPAIHLTNDAAFESAYKEAHDSGLVGAEAAAFIRARMKGETNA